MAGSDRLRACQLVLALGSLLLQIMPFHSQAAVNPVPVLAIKLDAANQCARVTESAAGIVTFTGQASIDKLPVESCTVYLNSSTDIGWASQISPTMTTFTSTTPQSFTCTVIVPPGTANSQYGNLFIRGRAIAEGLQSTAEVRGIIDVEPYFRCNLSCPQPYKEISPASCVSFTVWLNNMGNARDSFEIFYTDLKSLDKRGWIFLGIHPIPRVEPGEYKPFRVHARSPQEPTLWEYEPTNIVIEAVSMNAIDFQQTVRTTLQLTVMVRGNYMPNVDCGILVLVLAVGAVYWTVRLARRRR